MRCLNRNKVPFYYALFVRKEEVLKNGLYTGDWKNVYTEPVKTNMSVSPSKGVVKVEESGLATEYVRTIMTDDMECPFDVDTILWIGIEPEKDGKKIPHNYIISQKSPSLNSITYTVKEVKNDKTGNQS